MRRVVVLLLAAGCRQLFGLESPSRGGVVDAPDDVSGETVADAGTCVTASAECVDDVLRTCSGPDATAIDTPCAWGCIATDGAHCGLLVPSGGAVTSQDVAPDSMLMDVVLTGTVVIDTDTGAIGTTSTPEAMRAAGTGIKSGIDFHVNNGVGVFRFASLTVSAQVAPFGDNALALVASGTIDVPGTVSLEAVCLSGAGSLGGGAGGASGAGAIGSGGGAGGTASGDGGGGGGHGGAGGNGAGMNAGGGAFADARISMLVGGGGGGAIGRIRFNTATGTASVLAGAQLSPALGDPGSTCTQGVATIQ